MGKNLPIDFNIQRGAKLKINDQVLAEWNDEENKIVVPPVANGSIADGAVTTAKLANEAVTTAKLADEAVTADKLQLAESSEAGSTDGLMSGIVRSVTQAQLDGTPNSIPLPDNFYVYDMIMLDPEGLGESNTVTLSTSEAGFEFGGDAEIFSQDIENPFALRMSQEDALPEALTGLLTTTGASLEIESSADISAGGDVRLVIILIGAYYDPAFMPGE